MTNLNMFLSQLLCGLKIHIVTEILFRSSTYKKQLLLEITYISDDKIFNHVFVPKESVINLFKTEAFFATVFRNTPSKDTNIIDHNCTYKFSIHCF